MTGRTKVDVHFRTLSIEFNDNLVSFNIFEVMKHPTEGHSLFSIDIIDELVKEYMQLGINSVEISHFVEILDVIDCFDSMKDVYNSVNMPNMQDLSEFVDNIADLADLVHMFEISNLTNLVYRLLPDHLKYAYLDDHQHFPIIIANHLHREQEEKLLNVLRKCKKEIEWTLSNLPGIKPSICMHKILLEEEAQSIRQQQRRLNPTILDVVKKEMNASVRISMMRWCQLKFKIADYLHLPIRNIRLHPDVVWLVQHSEYIPKMYDQYFLKFVGGLHGSLHGQLHVYVASFEACLENLSQVLTRCMETNLMLNFKKCHFMVTEGIVLGHLISSRGIEVNKDKVDIIISLPNPAFVREARSFLGHASFYRRFIKNFSKIVLPLSKLLQKDVNFIFDQPYMEAFQELKKRLTSTPILHAPNWEYPFKLMCDASNSALGAILGQRVGKQLHPIVFAFDKFHSYLFCPKIIIFSDHATLKFLLKKLDAKPRLIRWMLLLQEFDLEIREKKSAENAVANHLS
ncbi:Retrovirus-related Pol polyprotein from transposon 17.6, partial [Mucuna pruriens]